MKLLYVTSLSGQRINAFMRSAILAAQRLNIDFTIACNMNDADQALYREDCQAYGITAEHIDFVRNPLAISNYTQAKKQLLALMQREKYDAVHCNTPIGGVLGRICAKKTGIPCVIYQAHGFHFWHGAPLINWICYYPVERVLAHDTDLLLTINREDFERAQHFRLKQNGRVIRVPGVGVDIGRFTAQADDPASFRKKLGIPADAFIFLSVGELDDNKNHMTAIRAFAEANVLNSYYVICGKGEQEQPLRKAAQCLHVADRVLFLGFRSDIPMILSASDCFVFPSRREGLPSALMEAMAAGLPCIASRIRGNTDLVHNDACLFAPNDAHALTALMRRMTDAKFRADQAAMNRQAVAPYDIANVVAAYQAIYESI